MNVRTLGTVTIGLVLLQPAASGQEALTFKKIDAATILVTSGIDYGRDVVLSDKRTIEIEDVDRGVFIPVEGLPFIPEWMQDKDSQAGPTSLKVLSSAVGITWVFTKPKLIFFTIAPAKSDNVYFFESLFKGATVEFRKDGVLIRGFELRLYPPTSKAKILFRASSTATRPPAKK